VDGVGGTEDQIAFASKPCRDLTDLKWRLSGPPSLPYMTTLSAFTTVGFSAESGRGCVKTPKRESNDQATANASLMAAAARLAPF
jgi:hypothetical protein